MFYPIGDDQVKNGYKPIFTYLLILTNVVLFFYQLTLTDEQLSFWFREYGATPTLVLHGQNLKSLVTGMFLHGGLIHLALNMYSLYAIGPLVERVYGKAKYIAIYFIAGIASSLFSYIFSDSISIGASGAIFGILGATLVFAITIRKTVGKDFYNNILQVMVVNLIIGFSIPNIDNFGHIGGMLGGIIMGKTFEIYRKK